MRLVENSRLVIKDAFGTSATTATNSVNMKNYNRCQIRAYIVADSGSAVSGGAITLKQGASSTASTALAFSEYFKNADVLAGSDLTKVSASSISSSGTASKTELYVFEVRADMLEDGYTYVRCNVATLTNAKVWLEYHLYEPRYAAGGDAMPSDA